MIHFKLVQYLTDRSYVTSSTRIMDVGTQNILFATDEEAISWIKTLRPEPLQESDVEGIRKLCYFSTPRPGERTAFLHEFLSFTSVDYQSIDIVDGLKTTIFDLNADTPSSEWKGAFDFVLNCGTLEHVINQLNALTFIHDVLKPGGYWFDQPPSVGFLNHGYYNYNPLFYLDIAAANGYDTVEAWYSEAGAYPLIDDRFPIIAVDRLDDAEERQKAAKKPFSAGHAPAGAPTFAPSYNFNALLRKVHDAPLRLPLELRTTHGAPDQRAQDSYGSAVFDSTSSK